MKKILFVLPLFLVFTSCNKLNPSALQCDLEDGLEGTLAYGIETVFNCTGTAAVRASVNSWVDSAGVCSKGRLRGAAAGAVCGLIVTAIGANAAGPTNVLLNTKFPGWNCDTSKVVADLASLARVACTVVFPTP